MNMTMMKELHPKQLHIIDIWGKEPTTMDEFAEACIKVVNNTKVLARFNNKPFTPKLTGFAWDIKYKKQISNTHHAPLNGVTNWHCHDDKPKNYPGFYGRVWIRLDKDYDCWSSELLDATLTHTGSGGGGAYDGIWQTAAAMFYKKYGYKNTRRFKRPQVYSYDYRFFVEDHPWLEKYINWEILKGNNPESLTHVFQWTDEETLEHDRKLIDFVKRTMKL